MHLLKNNKIRLFLFVFSWFFTRSVYAQDVTQSISITDSTTKINRFLIFPVSVDWELSWQDTLGDVYKIILQDEEGRPFSEYETRERSFTISKLPYKAKFDLTIGAYDIQNNLVAELKGVQLTYEKPNINLEDILGAVKFAFLMFIIVSFIYIFIKGLMISLRCHRIISFSNIFPIAKEDDNKDKEECKYPEEIEKLYNLCSIGKNSFLLKGKTFRKRRSFSNKFSEKIVYKWKAIILDMDNYFYEKLQELSLGGTEEARNQIDYNQETIKLKSEFWMRKGQKELKQIIKYIESEKHDGRLLEDYASVKVLQAGLKNHQSQGLHPVEVSNEIDRAIENRASSELQKLRSETAIDQLWVFGTVSPLLGLLGTATGLWSAFNDVQNAPNIDISVFAAGIVEALLTTIVGLVLGISFMFIYHRYDSMLKIVYTKWEELYVYISESL